MSKTKSFIPLFEDYFDQINLLSFDQAGMLFALIRCSGSMDEQSLSHFASTLSLSDGTRILWAFIQADLSAYYAKKRSISEANARNARKRWGSVAPVQDVPAGQKQLLYTVTASGSDAEPSLTVHAPGMPSDATASKKDANECGRMSPIYNNNSFNNTDNNACVCVKEVNLKDASTPPVPDIEEIKSFFLANGSTEEAAMDYCSYYAKRDWKTGDGKPIFDFARSVRLWVERNAEYQKKQAEKLAKRIADAAATKSDSAARKQRGSYPGKSAAAKAKKAGAQFHHFNQRTYDFDELLKDLYPEDYAPASPSPAADPDPVPVAEKGKRTTDELPCVSNFETGTKPASKGFHNFEQRTYDYDALVEALTGNRKAVV